MCSGGTLGPEFINLHRLLQPTPEKVRVDTREAIEKARQQAQRKYAIAEASIVATSEDRLSADKHRLASQGSVRSSGMYRLVGINFAERLKALLAARLNA